MQIGIIVASRREWEPFFRVFGKNCVHYHSSCDQKIVGWEFGRHCIYLIQSGYGEIAAASATQYLIDEFYVESIINYGVVGGLHENYPAKKVGFVRKIVHYGFDVSGGGKYPIGRYPNQEDLFIKPEREALPLSVIEKALGTQLTEFVCASADKFVYGGEAKRQLREKFGADICEMEAAGVVLTCNRNHVPCSFIKAVSDGVDEDEKAFHKNVQSAAKICAKTIKKILEVL